MPGKAFAGGGLITSPTVALMGESGPEGVVNTRGMQALGAGGLAALNFGDPQGFLGGGRMLYFNFNINMLDARDAEQFIETTLGSLMIQHFLSKSTQGVDVVHQSGVRGAA